MIEVCDMCKKKFIINTLKRNYTYKISKYAHKSRKYYCSYNCMRAKQKELEQEMEM